MDDETKKKARQLIANHEGRRSKTYIDTMGHPTVGIGFNLDRPDARQRITALGLDYDSVRSKVQDLNNQQIDTLFDADLEQAAAGARKVVASFDDLPEEAQVVLIDMVFNLGQAGLSNFKHMIAALNAGDYQGAAKEMRDSQWAKQVPLRANQDIAMMEKAEAEEADPAMAGGSSALS